MYMLNFVDYVNNFGFSDWLNLVIYNLGVMVTICFILMFLSFIGYVIYEVICLINKVENLEKEVKKLKKGGKK